MTRWAMTALLATLLAALRPAMAGVLLLDEDFAHFTGAGLAPDVAGALDSRSWAVLGLSDGDTWFDETRSGGDFARGTSAGGERSGGLYAFDLPGGLRGPGVQATGSDFTPGSLLRRVQNTSGVALGGLMVLFDLWVLNDGARSTRVQFDAHVDPSLETGRRDETATRTTPGAADDLGWQPLSVSASILDLDVPEQGEVLLRWLFDDAGGRGGRDEWALSRLRVEGLPANADEPVPVALAAPATPLLTVAALVLWLLHRVRLRTGRRLPIRNAVATPRHGPRS